MRSKLQSRTRTLVTEFLLRTSGLPRERIAAIAGVGIATIARWERIPPNRIHLAVRLRLTSYLEHDRAAREMVTTDPAHAHREVAVWRHLESRVERISTEIDRLMSCLAHPVP